MYMHTTISKTNDGTIRESFLFSDISARTLKSSGALTEMGVTAIIASERAKHPSPEAMITALKEEGIDLSGFYAKCKAAQTEIDRAKTEKQA